jgi:biopolymer transport protein ExbB/TolQ
MPSHALALFLLQGPRPRPFGTLFASTGIVGPLLVLAGIAAVVFAVRCWLALRPARLAPAALQKSIETKLHARDVEGAMQAAASSKTVLGNIVADGLFLRAGGLDEMLAGVERAMAKELLRLGNRVANLARWGGIVLLVGLFGTSVSIMNTMAVLAILKSPTLSDLATGVCESLVNTTLATGFALFCFVAYFVLDWKLTHGGLALREIAEEMVRDAAK